MFLSLWGWSRQNVSKLRHTEWDCSHKNQEEHNNNSYGSHRSINRYNSKKYGLMSRLDYSTKLCGQATTLGHQNTLPHLTSTKYTYINHMLSPSLPDAFSLAQTLVFFVSLLWFLSTLVQILEHCHLPCSQVFSYPPRTFTRLFYLHPPMNSHTCNVVWAWLSKAPKEDYTKMKW